jgi:hypothetical protein
MRKTKAPEGWVVYKMTIHGRPTEVRAVCEQGEWDAMEAASPGHHKLVREGIASEPEAERLARGTAGDARKTGYPRRAS